jgi:hypothetical protein
MHDRSPNRIRVRTTGSKSEAKSLSRNILQISRCESRFYPYPTPISTAQLHENKDFIGFAEKNIETQEGPNKKADHEVCPNLLVEKVTAKAT